MHPSIAQSGLFITSIVAMYVLFGIPVCLAIAAIAALLGGGSAHGFGWSREIFARTFRWLALGLGVLVLAACIWAAWTIPGR